MIFVGNGDTAGLHHPDYDFNDELIPVGCSYWARLVETRDARRLRRPRAMPLVRIDLPRGSTPERRQAIADAVYAALRATLDVPDGDRFQVITEHDDGTLLIDPAYLGITRSRQALIVQVTLSKGRSREQKRAFYQAVADGLYDAVGLRREDVAINLVEVDPEDWSFGNGVAQYV